MGGQHHRSTTSASSSSARSFFSSFCSAALRRKPIELTPTSSANTDGLVRHLGPFELVLLGIGASIGAGIFVVTGTVARDAGPGVTISFILAGAACTLNALCYAELSTRFPAVVGGAYLYAYSAFNELTAFLVFAQLMLDYHIGAASIARSLASYFVSLLELFPFLTGHFPSWIGHGKELFGGVVSLNLLAPVLLAILTYVLCYGVKESSAVNSFMTTLKVTIVLVVILVGAFEVDVSNWTPFAPNGFKEIVTGATVVFFAYVGFDAVANSAEETKKPQRDLPIGILGSLIVCITLYVCVCLVITGMVPYQNLGADAPLAEAFAAKGLKFVSVLISIGAVAGLTTTLLVGLYVQSRLYLGLGRDGLLPSVFAQVHPNRHTPVNSQIWVGIVAAVLAGIFNVTQLSHILSVGTLTGYSVVSACVLTLRWKDRGIEREGESSNSGKQQMVSVGAIPCPVVVESAVVPVIEPAIVPIIEPAIVPNQGETDPEGGGPQAQGELRVYTRRRKENEETVPTVPLVPSPLFLPTSTPETPSPFIAGSEYTGDIHASKMRISSWCEGVTCLVTVAVSSFAAGLCYRFGAPFVSLLIFFLVAFAAAAALYFRQEYGETPGFSCPGIPFVPIISIFFNFFLFAQLHEEGWYRFVILSLVSVGIYAFYGQHNATSAITDHYHPISTDSA